MTDIVKIPLASDPSDELSRKFSDILHEHGVGDMESIVVGATCLNMLSKMGASLEKVKMSLSEGTSKITKLQMKLGAWREREKSKAGRAKRVALERLDPEASAEKHASVKQRRRMNWHRKKAIQERQRSASRRTLTIWFPPRYTDQGPPLHRNWKWCSGTRKCWRSAAQRIRMRIQSQKIHNRNLTMKAGNGFERSREDAPRRRKRPWYLHQAPVMQDMEPRGA